MRIDAMRRPPVGLSNGVQALKVEQKSMESNNERMAELCSFLPWYVHT